MTPMKILFCANSFTPATGGAENVCKNMVDILSSAGHDVTIITQPHSDRKGMSNVVEMQGMYMILICIYLLGMVNIFQIL
jgi:flavodoxin